MKSSTLLAVFGATALPLASAAQDILTLFLPDTDPQPLEGSIVSSSPSTTVVAVGCPPGANADACDFAAPGGLSLTVTQISRSTVIASIGLAEDGFTWSFSCDVTMAKSQAVCVESAGGDQANDPGIATTTYAGASFDLLQVTITDGQGAAATAGSDGSGSAATATAAVTGWSAATATGTRAMTGASAATATPTSGMTKASKGTRSRASWVNGWTMPGQLIYVAAAMLGIW